MSVLRFNDRTCCIYESNVMISLYENVGVQQSCWTFAGPQIINGSSHRIRNRPPSAYLVLRYLASGLPVTVADETNTVEVSNSFA
jgi:hypothetical protein